MYKKILSFFSLSVILLLLLFWQPIAGFFVNYCVKSYCRYHFGKGMEAKGMYREQGFWVFEKPLLHQSGAKLSAKRLLVGFGIKPMDRTLKLDLIIEDSQIDLLEGAANLEAVIRDLITKSVPYWLFNIHTSFLIKNGTVFWVENGDKEPLNSTAHFSFIADSSEVSKQASLALFLGGKTQSSNYFNFQVGKRLNEPGTATLKFRNVDCQKISKIAEGFTEHGQLWQIDEGVIDGNIQLSQSEHRRTRLSGQATLRDCTFHNDILEISGAIKQGQVNLETKIGKSQIPRILGTITLPSQASFTLSKKGKPQCKIEGITGEMTFLPEEGIHLDFNGGCKVEDHFFGISLQGDARVFDETQAAIDMMCRLSASNRQEGLVHLSARQLGTLYNSLEIQLKNFGKDEFNLLHTIVSRKFPELDGLKMLDGKIDASGIAYLEGVKFTEVQIEKIHGKQLQFDFDPLDCIVGLDEVLGDLKIQLTANNPLDTLGANFALKNCKTAFYDLNSNLLINTNLRIRNGILQQSEMVGEFAGLKGSVVVDWGSEDQFLKVDLTGPSEVLKNVLPAAFEKGLSRSFSGEKIDLKGGVSWVDSGARFKGSVEHSNEIIAFGFDLQKSSEKLWNRWPADDLATSYWEIAGLEAMQTVMPPITYPAILLESNWINAESGIAGIVIRKGWFTAKDLPLEKYAAPFIFPEEKVHLTGISDVNGVFDHTSISVEFSAENLVLENETLAIRVDKIHSSDSQGTAFYFYDFLKGEHYGFIPIAKAAYEEKTTGLLFNDIDASIHFETANIRCSNVYARCHGLAFVGNMGLDFDVFDDQSFTLDIHVDDIKGSLADLRKMIEQVSLDIPIPDMAVDGKVALNSEGADLKFNFKPEEFTFDAEVEGLVTDGSFEFDALGVGVKDVKFNFSYTQKNKSTSITNLSGRLWVGKPSDQQEFFLSGEYIRFADRFAEMDLWVGDKHRDILRVVAKTLPQTLSFMIDHEKTHIGDAHPTNFQLDLKDWQTLENFNLNIEFRLNTLLKDFQRIFTPGFLQISPGLSKGIKNLGSSSGNVKVNFHYDGVKQEFRTDMTSSPIAIGDVSFDRCELTVLKKGDYWCLDTCILDDVSLFGYVRKKEDRWAFDQMSLRIKDAISWKMDGEYLPEEHRVASAVSSLKLDLAHAGGVSELFDSFVQECQPHGLMRGSGNLRIDFPRSGPWLKLEAILDVSLESWDMKGLSFHDVQNVSCHFVSDQGITFRNLSTQIITRDTQASRAGISVERVHFEFLNGDVSLEGLKFRVPAHHLPWFTGALSKSFPTFVTPVAAQVLRNLKLQGSLDGTLQYEYNPPYTSLRLAFEDGKYMIFNAEHELRNFVLEYDPFELNITSNYVIGNETVWMYGRSTSPNLSYGEFVLTKMSPDRQMPLGYGDALFIFWENDSVQGLSIKHAEGTFFGLDFKMQKDPAEELSDEALFLVGSVGLDLEKAKVLFPLELAEKVSEWQAGSGYTLQGRWKVQKKSSQDYAKKLHFIGTIEGKEFVIDGYQFDQMAAHLEYTPQSARLQDFQVQDASLTLLANRIDLVTGSDGHWYFSVPSMKVEKFRPSLLRQVGTARPHFKKPLVFREVLLEKCQGSLIDSNTIVGQGTLRFSNRSKKMLHNTIFQIPADILSRIGLDLSVLTPVTGMMEFRLVDGKVVFTKLKDVYSDSKLSKFYLSPSPPSTMDFNGNLSFHVRMKQHNLLFKIAELFTVNIGGNLEKPTYSLTKQGKEEASIH